MSTSALTASLTSSLGIYAVLKLTKKNWVEFKTKTVMSLMAQGLACHLDGTVKTPQPLPHSHDKDDKLVVLVTDKLKTTTEEEIDVEVARAPGAIRR